MAFGIDTSLVGSLADSYVKGEKWKQEKIKADQMEADQQALANMAQKSPGGIPSSQDLSRFYFSRGDAKSGMALHKIQKEDEKQAADIAKQEQEQARLDAVAAMGAITKARKDLGPEGFKKAWGLLQNSFPKQLEGQKAEDWHYDESRNVVTRPIPPNPGELESPGWVIYDESAGPDGSIQVIGNKDLQHKLEMKKQLNENERLVIEAQKADTERARLQVEREKVQAKAAVEAAGKKRAGASVDNAFTKAGIDLSKANPAQKKAYGAIKARAEMLVLNEGIPSDLAANQAALEYHDPKLRKAYDDRTDTDVEYIEQNYEYKTIGNKLVIIRRLGDDEAPKSSGASGAPKKSGGKKLKYDPKSGTFK